LGQPVMPIADGFDGCRVGVNSGQLRQFCGCSDSLGRLETMLPIQSRLVTILGNPLRSTTRFTVIYVLVFKLLLSVSGWMA
jgi:hypothetical protein